MERYQLRRLLQLLSGACMTRAQQRTPSGLAVKEDSEIMEEVKELLDAHIEMCEKTNAAKCCISYEYRGYRVELSVTRLKKAKE